MDEFHILLLACWSPAPIIWLLVLLMWWQGREKNGRLTKANAAVALLFSLMPVINAVFAAGGLAITGQDLYIGSALQKWLDTPFGRRVKPKPTHDDLLAQIDAMQRKLDDFQKAG